MKAQRLIWALNRLPRFGIQTFKRLQEKHSHLAESDDSEILNLLAGFDPNFPQEFARILGSGEFELDLEKCHQAGIRMMSILDSDYPQNLAAIYDPPLILYVKGRLISEDQFSIAVVGSRHPTTYGIRVAGKFSSELSERGMTIVSGLARGIDAEAHRGSLRARGRTIAVLGCGLDIIYPKEHASLYQQIIEHGAVVSELPLGTIPEAFNFPQRNRIITGLSLGVLVVEANQRSGSLITASIAAEEGREVYAIPGPIDSITAQGTNHLIQTGAKLVASPDDILVDLHSQLKSIGTGSATRQVSQANINLSRSEPVPHFNETTNSILKLLTNEPLSLDEIMIASGGSSKEIASELAQLEVHGLVKRVFGGRYVRTPVAAIT